MKLDKKKLERQRQIFHTWIKNLCRGTLEAVTGFGKTFCAILAIKYFAKLDPTFQCIVCVPRVPLKKQWEKEASIHGISDHVHVDTVHNLVKGKFNVDMLVLDELHMYVGEDAQVFPTIFEKVKTDKILGLTATLGTDGIRNDLIAKYCPIIDKVELDEALREGYVSDYIQYNLGIDMSDEDKKEYAKIDSRFYKYFATFNFDFDLVKSCLKYNNDRLVKPEARRFADEIRWDHHAVMIHAVNCMRAMRERKQFLYSAKSKLDVAEQIIRAFPNRKIITFGQTTDSADLLSARLPYAESYHSSITTRLYDESDNCIGRKVGKDKYVLYSDNEVRSWKEVKRAYSGKILRRGTKTLREYVIDKFKNNEIRVLCTATALDVGLDIADIDMGIILSGTSKNRQDIQRKGRVLRVQEGKRAIIVQLYIKDSQDERWLDKRQTTNNNVKDIVSITQIQI